MNKRSRIKLSFENYKALCRLVMERDGWKCKHCKVRSNLHSHHIVFRSHQGPDASWNMLTLCSDCHDLVHGKGKWKDQLLVIVPKEGDACNADTGNYKFEVFNVPNRGCTRKN